jgi:hypothetical protein
MFILHFAAVITLLVKETNQYYQQYLDRFDNRTSPVTDNTGSEIFLCLVIITQIERDRWDSLQDYWTATEQFLTAFYSKRVT